MERLGEHRHTYHMLHVFFSCVDYIYDSLFLVRIEQQFVGLVHGYATVKYLGVIRRVCPETQLRKIKI